ncbi:E3 ubiquitin-protein ligase Midline-1-like isoform X2 [Engraulis encrasicolus]|uniref:E3 ubiquitin-protein ligase Midline-1-like isoform X2 n=1 Tax=Engraulis encrasicolus TaxID=184585 RepID=UPI002FCF3E66
MAEAALQDLYQCSVCLDTLKDPVTTPCGHSYCQKCISDYWNQAPQTGVYSCPQCREKFSPRPALKKNTVLTELISQIKISSAGLSYAEPGDVECDVCTGRKLKAVKSCLVCLASFCDTHVQPHYKAPAFKRHDLIEASAHLQEKLCPNHGRLLEMFCRTDQTCICMLCTTNDHKGHDLVSTAAGSQEQKITLGKVRKTSMDQIQERAKKLSQLKNALVFHQRSADTAVHHSARIFSELLQFLISKGTELNEMIRDQQGAAVSRAEPVIKCLEQEIAELEKQQDDLEQLSREEDHVQFLQSFMTLLPTLKSTHALSTTTSPSLSFNDPSGSLSVFKEEMEQLCKRHVKEITVRLQDPLREPVCGSKPLVPNHWLRYDREFLLAFQFMPPCLQKPHGLPQISNVVLDNATHPKCSLSILKEEKEQFCKMEIPDCHQEPLREPLLLATSRRDMEFLQSLQDDIDLNKAESPWKPSMMRKVARETFNDPEALKTEELFCKVRSILNKLMPQTFQKLMKQVYQLTIDTEERLKGVIELVFEKAIGEPNFSVAYANMCRCLMGLKVPITDKPSTTVNFRKLLLNRCKNEFERNKADGVLFERKQRELDSSVKPLSPSLFLISTERERLQEELVEAKDKARRRSIGNIKLIGELFKLKMLTEPIMHDCVVKLLKRHDEESLECLCSLLTTIGKDMDHEKAKPRMDQYFHAMERIINERKTSSRIRFMLQDVIDLRMRNWVSLQRDQDR